MEGWRPGERAPMESDMMARMWGCKDGHGVTQEVGFANKLMRLWSPAGEFAYISKEIPVITFCFLCCCFVLFSFYVCCLYTPQGKISPMAKNRSKEDNSSRWSECLNSKTCCSIPLCLRTHRSHNDEDKNGESNGYRLLSTYYGSGT